MHNEFENGTRVIIYGPGENDGKMYFNQPAIIIERDPYYLDYHVKFKDGNTDWFAPEHIRKPYSKKRRRKNEDKLY